MKYLIYIFLLICALSFPMIVNAQAVNRLYTFLDSIAWILRAVGSALAIIVIIVGGIMYMTAGADESRVTNAKKTITYGLIGLVIVLAATFIIDLLDEVVLDQLNPPAV